jgi:hypothetical protein
MNKKVAGFYHSLVVLPDRLYPFKTEIEGQWVRGIRSYNSTLDYVQRKYGRGHYGYKLSVYRQFFHAVSSILIMIGATFLLQYYFGSTVALYVFLGLGILFISFQEFYLQRRTYQQLWRKGVLDWLSWCVPAALYMFTYFH